MRTATLALILPFACGCAALSGVPSGGPWIEVTGNVVSSSSTTTLNVTVQNRTNSNAEITLKQLDLNLYEPLSGLPARFSLPGSGTTTFTLQYPAGAATRSATEQALILPSAHLGASDPALNSRIEFSLKGFHSTGGGSEGDEQIREPWADLSTKPHKGGLTVLVGNDEFSRAIDFRIDSISIGRRILPLKSTEVRVPPHSPKALPALFSPPPARECFITAFGWNQTKRGERRKWIFRWCASSARILF